ncbi:MAG: Flp pilus assembly protein CpaB [Lentisphaerae bacterium]|nr:Flp pilus assembly protein CpaB [Lentisphaerota bacterium]
MKQKIVPIVAIVVGVLAFLLTFQYLRGKHNEYEQMRRDFYKNARQIDVIVANEDIPEGTILARKDLRKKTVYEMETSVRGHVVTADDADMLIGRRTLFRVAKGEAMFWSDIEGGASAATLAVLVRPGLRAVSLAVGGASAVSSLVQPNDRVDILGSFFFPSKKVEGEMETVTLTVLQDVSVLATGQELASQRSSRRSRNSNYSTVTVEVTPREAELLVFAQQMKGRLTLSLRNPSDVSFEKDLPEVDFSELETNLPALNLFRQKTIRHKKDL